MTPTYYIEGSCTLSDADFLKWCRERYRGGFVGDEMDRLLKLAGRSIRGGSVLLDLIEIAELRIISLASS